MRFCPFCSAENADELAACQACGRRLPPLPPRRARNAPPTGVQLPPRSASTTQPPPLPMPRKTGTTQPPPIPGQGTSPRPSNAGPTHTTSPMAVQHRPPAPLLPRLPGTTPVSDTSPLPIYDRPPARAESAPSLPPPLAAGEDGQRSLLAAISPGPAAQRREPPATGPQIDDGRRRTDLRAKPASVPPPLPTAPVLPPGYPKVDLGGSPNSDPIHIAAQRLRSDGVDPPPTRIHRSDALADRPFAPPKVNPIPEIPEPGLVNASRYAMRFGRARWQRRGAIKTLGAEINQDTDALDQVLGALGRVARNAKVESRVFSAENAAITAAEERKGVLGQEHRDVDARKAEENSKFVDVERERNTKLGEAERLVDEAAKELAHLEGRRRGLRDKRKEVERRQRAYLKSAEDNDRSSGATGMGETRAELRRSAEQHRKEAAALEPERQDMDRQLASLERPIAEATARLDAAKAELDAAKRSLNDTREGHTHRLAELDAEQKRKSREIGQSEAEVQRRLVTLGTLVNLNRIVDPQFDELYQRIDRLRGAITARTTEIEKLTAEREAYDRGTLVRGIAAIGGAIVALIALIVILRAVLT
ncbi:MAG: hypothetical protein WKG01_10075 [Kofleriaceae bacterium]